MVNRLTQSLLGWALIVLISLTTAASPAGPRVLCVATGDHEHVSIESSHAVGHCRHVTHSHEVYAEDGTAVQATHEHACFDIALPSGDLQTQVRKTIDPADGAAVYFLPPAPLLAMLAAGPPLQLQPRSCVLPGSSPPEVVRTTVLLI